MSAVELCERCNVALDNVSTGIVWVHLKDSNAHQNNFRLCGACAKVVIETEGATELIRAKKVATA